MIQIPEQPTVTACGSCQKALHWLWSQEKQEWVALVSGPDRWTPQWHRCRPLQAPGTWRALAAVPDPDQPARNAAGRQAVEQALKSKSSNEGEETR